MDNTWTMLVRCLDNTSLTFLDIFSKFSLISHKVSLDIHPWWVIMSVMLSDVSSFSLGRPWIGYQPPSWDLGHKYKSLQHHRFVVVVLTTKLKTNFDDIAWYKLINLHIGSGSFFSQGSCSVLGDSQSKRNMRNEIFSLLTTPSICFQHLGFFVIISFPNPIFWLNQFTWSDKVLIEMIPLTGNFPNFLTFFFVLRLSL